MSDWQKPETAPKDGTVIIADVGYPWARATVWNSHREEWVCAAAQVDQFKDGDDYYFQNETERVGELKKWQPMPDL